MATRGGADQADEARQLCTPCGGAGKVISGLGRSPHEVTCPWCGGSGRFQPGVDAQATGAELRAAGKGEKEPAEPSSTA